MDELLQPLSPAELERYLRSGLASRDETYRDLVIAQVLSQFTAQDAPYLIAVFEGALRKIGDNEDILKRFVARWARLDGRSAVDYALGSDYSSDASKVLTSRAVASWAETDPEACRTYLDERDMADSYFVPYIKGAMVGDPETFEGVLANLEDKELRRKTVFEVAERLKSNLGARLDWAERTMNMENPDPEYVQQVLRMTFFYKESGPALAQWIDRNAASPWLDPDTLNRVEDLYKSAATGWATTDPLAALDWVERNASDPRMPDRIYDSLMHGWRETDAPGNIAWITQNLADERVSWVQVAGAVNEWAKTDPAAAADWVQRNIEHKNVGESAVSSLVERWAARAPDETLDWVRSLPEDKQGFPLSSAAE